MSMVLVGDFETTVYEGQTDTQVWASALVPMYSEDVLILHSIGETYDYIKKLATKQNVIVYYHNLKFDGSFWVDFLEKLPEISLAYTSENLEEGHWLKNKEQPPYSYRYVVSDMGQWYSITIKFNRHTVELRDSLKLLPFSVREIGQSFDTKHKKLDMQYEGFRYPGCKITAEERKYIANDVLVIKEALEIMYNEGHNSLTIGSCCLLEFMKSIGKDDYKMFFPDIYDSEERKLDPEVFGSPNAGEYIRKSYRGGWCYLARGKENRIFHGGTTADVNSLYPSMMHSESGNYYPVSIPHFWRGDIPKEALYPERFYFVRVRTRFYLKPGKLPFIQIKDSIFYSGTESLETSDIRDRRTGKYYKYYKDTEGRMHHATVIMTLTKPDLELIREHYDLVEFEVLDGCWFYAEIGLFDAYINKYRKIKMESKGAKRQLAKLFLNNLYGKMASSKDSSYKVGYEKDGVIHFTSITEFNKTPGYIPIGSAITSYARCFTIRSAQANYHGVDKPGFIYADTDSIHCDLPPEELVGIKVHPKNFCCWALESCWDEALFVRQKTYIEHVTHNDLIPVENPYYDVKCAGMPKKCKNLFLKSVEGWDGNTKYVLDGLDKEYTPEEQEFLSTKREITDFRVGLCVPGKLMPKRIPGGILLVDTEYKMHEKIF